MARDDIAKGIVEGLEEAIAWRRGQLDLEAIEINPTPSDDTKDREQPPEAVEKAAQTA